MKEFRIKQYPSTLQAIHLVILYIFIQTVVDFPLAIFDYYRDTEYLYNPVKKILLGIGSVVFILWYGYKKTGNPLKDVFPLKKYNPVIFLLLMLFFLGSQQLLNVINAFIEEVLPPPAWFWEMFNMVFDSDFGFWGAFMKVVIIAPATEELIFRGVIMHGLMRNYSRFNAIFLSGLLFALFHLNPWQFPATFILGMILGWLMIRTHNIMVCITGHAINNLLVLLTISFHQQIAESPLATLTGKSILIISFLLIVLSLVFMYLATKGKKAGSNTNQQAVS
jgi:membrane protease YdiL (CAAX protease family)